MIKTLLRLVNKILICITLLNFISCSDHNKSDLKIKKEKSKIEKDNNFLDDNDTEKITLLSISKNLPQKLVISILNDYYEKTLIFDDKEIDYNKIIDTIAKKNNLPKQKVASIIFSFQYEQITQDEIIEKYSSEKEDYLNEKEDKSLEETIN
ncbi:hypothetical protein [Flavobacterium sp.]|uniref:hypothetical protein n=1 Tax=Flavobacterium sp. TaxID=239 RepID=UPI00374CE07C